MSKEFNYEKWVKECYDEKLDEEIHNASEVNALLLFQTLFDKAIENRENIKIISHQLLARFYNQLTDRLQQVIDNGNTVSVIVESAIDNKDENKFYQKLDKQYLKITSNFKELPNFIVVGDNAFRYETDKNSTKAIANFNNKSMGSFIADLFDKINKNA
jgi:sugar-specific transcriptional regulator TrmB